MSRSVYQRRSKLANEVKTAKRKNQPLESSEAVQAARRQLAEAKIADFIARTVAAAPPLDEQQRSRLAMLLRHIADGDAEAPAGVQ